MNAQKTNKKKKKEKNEEEKKKTSNILNETKQSRNEQKLNINYNQQQFQPTI